MIVLCSFADNILKKGFNRLLIQAQSFEIFDKTFFYTQKELDKGFRRKYKVLLRPYSKGYGYWIWKPQVIAQTLNLIDDGDIMLYIDLGSHLNISGKSRFMEYIDIVKNSKSGMLAFRSPEHLEKKLTKGDVFNFFHVENDKTYTDTTQIEATHILIRKCQQTTELINEWLCTLNRNYKLFTDSVSIIPESPEFESHRHDQSIFSILAKKYNIDTYSTNETFSSNWSEMNSYPLLAKRDKVLNHKWQSKYWGKIAKFYKLLWLIRYRNSL